MAAAVPSAGTLSGLRVFTSATPGNSNSWTFTIRKNSQSTGVTCTVSGSSANSCTDTTHTITFAATDTIDLVATPSSGPSPATVGWSAKLG